MCKPIASLTQCVDAEQFVVVSPEPPSEKNIEWYWQYDQSHDGYALFSQFNRVWVQIEPDKVEQFMREVDGLWGNRILFISNKLFTRARRVIGNRCKHKILMDGETA